MRRIWGYGGLGATVLDGLDQKSKYKKLVNYFLLDNKFIQPVSPP